MFAVGKTRKPRRRLLAPGFVAGIALTMLSCASQDASPSVAPTTASIDPQLARAIDAYTPFNAALDLYLAGESPDVAFAGLATQDFIDALQQEIQASPRSTVTRGSSSFAEEKLVDPGLTPGEDELALVVCRDLSRTKVVDASTGEDASTEARRMKVPTVISLVAGAESGSGLLIMGVEQWNEDGYCI